MNYNLFLQQKGATPAKVEAWSRFNDPVPNDGKPHGNSRKHGDASPAVQAQVIDSLIGECQKRGLSKEDTAHVLAIARVESGFNPDAAAGQSSASGIGQFISKTGASYGLTEANRFDIKANTRALVDHFLDNKALAIANGKDAAWVYKYHHDGPSQHSGGLSLAQKEVIPYAKAYTASTLLAELGSRAQDAYQDVKTYAHAAGREVGQQTQQIAQNVKSQVYVLKQNGMVTLEAALKEVQQRAQALAGGAQHQIQAAFPAFEKVSTLPEYWRAASTAIATAAATTAASAAAAYEKTMGPETTQQSPAQAAAPANAIPAEVVSQAPASLANSEVTLTDVSLASGTTITLAQALADHMTEKGFDEKSIAQAPALAMQVAEESSVRGADAAALVLHKEGDALASLVAKPEAEVFAKAGDSVLAMDNLEKIARNGLDTDAVAAIRGLAPNQTQPHSDLEVYQATPAELYAKALDPEAPLNSQAAVKELVAGLNGLNSRDGFSEGALPAQQDAKIAEAKEVNQAIEMSMDA